MKIFLAIAGGGTGCPEPFRRIKENADIFSGGGVKTLGSHGFAMQRKW